MKKLQNLGEHLSKIQQKQIMGGYNTILFCKPQSTTEPACEISVVSCPPQTAWLETCLTAENGKCKDVTHSAGCND